MWHTLQSVTHVNNNNVRCEYNGDFTRRIRGKPQERHSSQRVQCDASNPSKFYWITTLMNTNLIRFKRSVFTEAHSYCGTGIAESIQCSFTFASVTHTRPEIRPCEHCPASGRRTPTALSHPRADTDYWIVSSYSTHTERNSRWNCKGGVQEIQTENSSIHEI